MLVDWTNLVDSQLREEGKVIIGTFGKAFHAKG